VTSPLTLSAIDRDQARFQARCGRRTTPDLLWLETPTASIGLCDMNLHRQIALFLA